MSHFNIPSGTKSFAVKCGALGRARRFIRSFRRDTKGAILVELALALPLFLSMLAGIVEVGNYLILNLKLQHTVISIADLVTRDEEISEAVIADIFEAVPQIMTPYQTGADGVVIVSAISQNADEPARIFWQRSGGGELTKDSQFGSEGQPPNLPDTLTLRDEETIIATEIYYQYRPVIFQMIPEQTVSKTSFFRPRLGALQEVEP